MNSFTVQAFDDILEANNHYVQSFKLGDLEPVAKSGLAIVTCFDSRIEPLKMTGLKPGDAKVLRVAGGRVTESVVESLRLATSQLGVDRVAIVQHTECAAPDTGPAQLMVDVERVRRHVDIDARRIAGFIYDVRTGRLSTS